LYSFNFIPFFHLWKTTGIHWGRGLGLDECMTEQMDPSTECSIIYCFRPFGDVRPFRVSDFLKRTLSPPPDQLKLFDLLDISLISIIFDYITFDWITPDYITSNHM
jgi:hypothetical protein